ncbi:MAG: hypothetical protein LUD77_11700 [Clostridiales bacterium]|nr:hypothetical protein [Clostridiales bacterium]
MKVNKKLIGLILVGFGSGVVSGAVICGMGFFMGVVFIALGLIELFC